MNKYRGKYDDSYKLLKTEGNQDLKTQILVEKQLNKITTRRRIQPSYSDAMKQAMPPIPVKPDRILDLLCLSTQQLKQVFKQPCVNNTKKSIKIMRNTSLPKDFFTA